MSRFSVFRNIVARHKYQLLLTYTLFALEMLGNLLRPYFLGEAVNDLLKGSYRGLIWLSAVHLLWLLIGTFRHMYDTRTYSAIYTSFVTRHLSRRFDNTEVSKLSAHSTLAREFVDFLEYDFNYVVEALYNLVGSLVLLYFYEAEVVWLCLGMLLPVSVASYVYGKKMEHLNRERNDELERQVDIIATQDTGAIREHYRNLRKWQVKISDQEAWNFGVLEGMVLVVIALSLIITTRAAGPAMEAGDIIGIYNYILRFVGGIDTIPYSVQRLSALKDITRRMELETESYEG